MSEWRKRCHLTVDEKLRILEEAQQPGVQIAELCRGYGIGTSQFYTWWEQTRQAAKQGLSQPAGRKAQPKVDATVPAASPSAVYDVLRSAGTLYRPPGRTPPCAGPR